MRRNVLNRGIVVLAALVLTLAAVGAARADLLFSDSFNNAGTPAATDWGLNANLNGRLGGHLLGTDPGLLTKAWGLDTWSSPGCIRVNETTGAWNGADAMAAQFTGAIPHHGAIIQHNFNDAFIAAGGWFSVKFDFTPVYSADTTSSTAVGGGIFIGGKDATCSTIASATKIPGRFDPKCDLNIAFLGNLTGAPGGSASYKATFAGNGNGGSWAGFDSSPGTITAPKTYSFELTVSLLDNSFAQGKNASANLKWLDPSSNWVTLDLNGAAAGTDVSWVWDDDGNNYIGFYEQLQSNKTQYCKWDNIAVYGEVPEPSVLALLAGGLVGLLAYAWRKRK